MENPIPPKKKREVALLDPVWFEPRQYFVPISLKSRFRFGGGLHRYFNINNVVVVYSLDNIIAPQVVVFLHVHGWKGNDEGGGD